LTLLAGLLPAVRLPCWWVVALGAGRLDTERPGHGAARPRRACRPLAVGARGLGLAAGKMSSQAERQAALGAPQIVKGCGAGGERVGRQAAGS
jgi:hypothetical protein